jgi:hypothetical protein
VIKAEQALRDALFERRSCGNGSKGPRYSDWALTATASPRHFLLIRRSVSRPDHVTFYICWAPQEVPATMTLFVSIAGRRWPCEETFKAGKDVHGRDQCQARGFGAICRHSALTALAQLRHAAIRNALCGDITVTASSQQEEEEEEEKKKKKAELEQESAADLGIPLGDAPVPSRPGRPCPSGIAAIKLTIAETARRARLARQHAAGLISDARLAFHPRWSRWRRRHQARARWHHSPSASPQPPRDGRRPEGVTHCNQGAGTITSQKRGAKISHRESGRRQRPPVSPSRSSSSAVSQLRPNAGYAVVRSSGSASVADARRIRRKVTRRTGAGDRRGGTVARPLTLSAACVLLLGSGVMLLLWGVVTLSRRRAFNAAVRVVFDADSSADTSVGWLTGAFLVGAVFSIVLGCILLWLVIFVYQAAGVARIILWLVSPATLWFAWRTLVNNGASYLHADGTGPDDETARAEMNMVNDLTPWRFSGWYCSVTVGFGIASMFFVVSAAILLAVPGS